MYEKNITSKKPKNDKLLEDLFKAYFDARKNKRNTKSALEFELKYEENIFSLYEEIKNRTYKPGRSIAFIVNKPVKREIFASDFRDRVMHHLIYNYISPIFERLFINDSYSCRKGKGTLYGIKRVDHFMRACSENYSKDAWILKIDIEGYFMNIDKNLLYNKIERTLISHKEKLEGDLSLILFLLQRVIFANPVLNCVIKGDRENWRGLPKSKSLFFAGKGKGLPIGNLTSQLFGNIYLNEFDHFVKRKARFRCYGRYVDDMIFVSKSKESLRTFITTAREYLKENLGLTLHPKKIYLQHFQKGISFLGANVKPYRILAGKRIKGNFYKKIFELIGSFDSLRNCHSRLRLAGINSGRNPEIISLDSRLRGNDRRECWDDGRERVINESEHKADKFFDIWYAVSKGQELLAVFNSYLGMMSHFDTYNLRKKTCDIIQRHFGGVLIPNKEFSKVFILTDK